MSSNPATRAGRVLATLLLLATMALMPLGTARAEDPEKARELNAAAIESYKAKEYLKAIDLWLQATEFADNEQLIKLHKNLGLALAKLDRHPEAWFHLTTFMQRSPKSDGKVAKQVQELEAELKKLNVKVSVSSQPAGALAILPPGDRMHRLRTPFSWWLPPGEYAVELQLDGYVTERKILRVDLGGQDRFNFVLAEEATTGTLKLLGAAAGSSVRINGKAQGPLPYEADLEPGEYRLEVYYEDGRVWKGTGHVTPGQTTEMQVQVGRIETPPPRVEKPAAKGSNAWKWATLGGGVVVAGVGGVLHGIGISNNNTRYDEVRDHWLDQGLAEVTSVNDPTYINYVNDFNAVYDEDVKPYLTSAYLLYGLGGAAILTGAIALLVPPGSETGDGAVSFSVSPTIQPDQAGLDFMLIF
jgi:tetratricopeptide (TPR) repeat protein